MKCSVTHGMGQIVLWHGSTGARALLGLVFDHLHEKTCGLLAASERAWCGAEEGGISAPEGGQQQP